MSSVTSLSMTSHYRTARSLQSFNDVGVVNSDAHVVLVSIEVVFVTTPMTVVIGQTRLTVTTITVGVTSNGLCVAGPRKRVMTLTGQETADLHHRMTLDRCSTTPMEHLQVSKNSNDFSDTIFENEGVTRICLIDCLTRVYLRSGHDIFLSKNLI